MEEIQNQLRPNQRYAQSTLEALERGSHGLTKGQIQKVYEAQKQGAGFEVITANKDNSYSINEHEKHLYHVQVTIPQFDAVTGKDNSLSRISKFHPAMFEQCSKSGVWEGRHIKILHDPTQVRNFDEDGKFAKKPIAKII